VKRPPILSALLLLALGHGSATRAAEASPIDLSGWWYWDKPHDGELNGFVVSAPFKPEIAAQIRPLVEAFRAAKLPDVDWRSDQCRPRVFDGFNGGFEDDVEFLFSPGRLTITNESGLIRRIALGDAKLPTDVAPSYAGTSVARWEGKELVIETVGLHRRARWGKDVRIVERIALRGPDAIRISIHVDAPEVLIHPYSATLDYVRDRGHVYGDQSFCAEADDVDPSYDPQTGKQHLDLTPPPDLPPPPKD
jgi:hypothetical protein